MPPGAVPLQVLHQVEPGGLEFIPNQAQAEQPAAEGVLRVIGDNRLVGGGPLGQGLVANSQAELDVGFDFPGMGGGVEAAELHGTLGENSVEVQHAVPGLGVVNATFISAAVPDGFELVAGGGLAGIQLSHESLVCLLAPVAYPGGIDAQCFHKHVLTAGKDVCQVPQGLRGMGCCVDVDVDATGVIGPSALAPQQPHQLLDDLDVSVVADRRNDLATIADIVGDSAIAEGGPDGGIAHCLPGAALQVLGGPGVISATFVGVPGSEVGSHGLGGILAGNAGQFDFDSEVLVLHGLCPHCFDVCILALARALIHVITELIWR